MSPDGIDYGRGVANVIPTRQTDYWMRGAATRSYGRVYSMPDAIDQGPPPWSTCAAVGDLRVAVNAGCHSLHEPGGFP